MKRTKTEIMEGVECTESKIVYNNTVEYYRPNGVRVIRLHRTDILEFPVKGGVILNSGGWRTVTTKSRMNEFQQEVQVMQEKGIWYVSSTFYAAWNKEEWIPYFDGIHFSKDGKVINPIKTDPAKKEKALIKKINAYCKKIKDMKELPIPSSGDCWYCALKTPGGKSMGETFKSNAHLISHLKEKYVHGSLIWNALEWAGYQNPALIFQMDVRTSIVSAVRRYFKSQLGLAV
jgi:hypothetical protein